MFENIKNALESVGLLKPILIALNVFIPTMAMVYLFGRMLEVTKTNRGKNSIAAITAFTSSGLYITLSGNSMFDKIWNIYFVGCIVILFYVLIGFTLYSRVDTFFDKFAKDRAERKTSESAKRKSNGK